MFAKNGYQYSRNTRSPLLNCSPRLCLSYWTQLVHYFLDLYNRAGQNDACFARFGFVPLSPNPVSGT
jgi:hypothetical protein